MIEKTANFVNRMDGAHTERLLIETWWLFGFIPLYTRETIIVSNR